LTSGDPALVVVNVTDASRGGEFTGVGGALGLLPFAALLMALRAEAPFFYLAGFG